MKRKGFYPLYTTLGVVLILIAITVTLQWDLQGSYDFNSHIDRLTWLKINHAVENVRAMVSDSLKNIFQEAVLDIGRIENGTINPYLTHSKEEGWQMLVGDVKTKASKGFNDILPNIADYSDGYYNTFVFEEGINVTIGPLTADDLDVLQTEDGLVALAELPITVTNRFEGWEASLEHTNITIPLGIRLKDMYERAWTFNDHYEEIATWTFTGAIYARAYAAAYLLQKGAFLKEAHYDFDPIATVLFGNMQTVKDFAKDPGSVIDIGAIPAATWYAEWQYLSEPSFLPAGFDMEAEDKDSAKDAILNNYNMEYYENRVCSNLSASQKEECEMVYDLDKFEDQVREVRDERDKFEDLAGGLDNWFRYYDTTEYLNCKTCYEEKKACENLCKAKPTRAEKRRCEDKCDNKYDDCKDDEVKFGNHKEECQKDALAGLRIDRITCDQFREEANELLEDITDDFEDIDEEACHEQIDTTLDLHDPYGLDFDDDVKDRFKKNNITFGFEQTQEYCDFPKYVIDKLKDLNEDELTPRDISDRFCLRPSEVGDCAFDSDCDDEDCDVRCDYPSCPSDGAIYDCLGDDKVGSRYETCEECDDDGDCRDRRKHISQCTCRCRPSVDLLIEINMYLLEAREYVNKTYVALDMTYDSMKEQLKRREDISDLSEDVDKLGVNDLSYDVFSIIDTGFVKYDKGEFEGGKECYFDPGFENRDDGICGDSVESVTLYTVQIAAAALASVLSGGAGAPLLDYAKNFFPVIYESGVRYNLTETLIDDGNRVILKNVAGDGAELYTYAPFEFEIYKDHEFDIGSATLDRIIVYLYLPAISKGRGLQRAMDGLADDSCNGTTCN